jgi:hypothetical protein
MFPQMFPCLPTRGNIAAETKFASREAKMFPTKFRNINISCFPMFLTNPSVWPLLETWRNIGRKQMFPSLPGALVMHNHSLERQ